MQKYLHRLIFLLFFVDLSTLSIFCQFERGWDKNNTPRSGAMHSKPIVVSLLFSQDEMSKATPKDNIRNLDIRPYYNICKCKLNPNISPPFFYILGWFACENLPIQAVTPSSLFCFGTFRRALSVCSDLRFLDVSGPNLRFNWRSNVLSCLASLTES